MKAAAGRILEKPPRWDEKAGTIDFYYWYFATRALAATGGDSWTRWHRNLQREVLVNQHLDKSKRNLYGSWAPVDAWGHHGGRVYSTAILCMTLQAAEQPPR